ncbi:MAG: type II toxin-antitoxin system VapC family toxin [Actinomycetota bacterium]|nr:type II toxin-antitoxin system VapC family toxin [Actinomycetota bacterium]
MPADRKRVYFDANVFLAYVGNEEGRADTVQTLLDEARRSEIEILTSVLSIAEVAYGAHERDSGLTEAGEEAIDQLWTPASPVSLADVSQAATRRARRIIRTAVAQGLTGLRAADAIHLATAETFGCEVIFTYEREPRRRLWQEIVGTEVTEPITNSPQLGL